MLSSFMVLIIVMVILTLIYERIKQRWSRGHKARGQGQPFRGQTLSRPRTGMLEAKTKDTAASVLQKKRSSKKFFRQSPILWRTQNF